MATVPLASLVVRSATEALTLDAELIVAALDVQFEPGELVGLEGTGFCQVALRFELLPPSAKASDALAAAHFLRVAGYAGAKDKGEPARDGRGARARAGSLMLEAGDSLEAAGLR